MSCKDNVIVGLYADIKNFGLYKRVLFMNIFLRADGEPEKFQFGHARTAAFTVAIGESILFFLCSFTGYIFPSQDGYSM